MTILVSGLILFLGIHSLAAADESLRNRLAERLGELPWKALYSVIALSGFLMIVWGYDAARQTPWILYTPPEILRHFALLLLIPVFPLLLATYLPGRIQHATRHPMLLATKIWAVAHLLVNSTVADILLFGSFLVWAVMVRISFKRRRPRRLMIQAPAARLNDGIALVGGLAAYGWFAGWGHQMLIGVPPLAAT